MTPKAKAGSRLSMIGYPPNEPGLITLMTFRSLVVGVIMDLVRLVIIFGTGGLLGDETAASIESPPFFRTFGRKTTKYYQFVFVFHGM